MTKKKSLDDMLAIVTPDNTHSEVSTGNSVGKEIFESADFTELEKDITSTSMNTIWNELKNDTW